MNRALANNIRLFGYDNASWVVGSTQVSANANTNTDPPPPPPPPSDDVVVSLHDNNNGGGKTVQIYKNQLPLNLSDISSVFDNDSLSSITIHVNSVKVHVWENGGFDGHNMPYEGVGVYDLPSDLSDRVTSIKISDKNDEDEPYKPPVIKPSGRGVSFFGASAGRTDGTNPEHFNFDLASESIPFVAYRAEDMGFMNDALSCVEIYDEGVIIDLYTDSGFGGEHVRLDRVGKYDLRDKGIDDKVSSYTVTRDEQHTITATAGTGGTVTGGGVYANGASVTLTATPNTGYGYAFDGWYENGVKIQSASVSYIFTVTSDRTLEARFVFVDLDEPPEPDEGSVALDRLLELQNNTTTMINFNSTGQIVSLAVVSSNGSPIPAEVWFRILLLAQLEITNTALDYDVSTSVPVSFPSGKLGVTDVSILADETYYGPFLVKSASNASGGTKLDIDVDNLRKPDGSKGFIPAGSYKVKFADNSSSPVYVGMTEVIELPATSLSDSSDSSSGGCDAGLGTVGLAWVLAALGMAAKSKREKQ